MHMNECGSEVREWRTKGRRGDKRPVTDYRMCAGKNARGTVLELPNTSFMVVICRVPNGNNNQACCNQLRASYTDVRHWQELIDFIKQNCCQKEPYWLTARDKCNLTQEELDEVYMGSYSPGQMMNYPLYGQISYNSSLSNSFKLKLGQNLNLILIEMKAATGIDIAEHVMRLGKVITTSLVTIMYSHC